MSETPEPIEPPRSRASGPALWLIGVATVATIVLVVGGFGGTDDDLTPEQMVTKLAGPRLSGPEIEDRLALADLLCGLDGRVLSALWPQLNPEELEFQDWVFAERCPDRLSAYASIRPETGVVALDADDDPDAEAPDDDTGTPLEGGGGNVDSQERSTTTTAPSSRRTTTEPPIDGGSSTSDPSDGTDGSDGSDGSTSSTTESSGSTTSSTLSSTSGSTTSTTRNSSSTSSTSSTATGN